MKRRWLTLLAIALGSMLPPFGPTAASGHGGGGGHGGGIGHAGFGGYGFRGCYGGYGFRGYPGFYGCGLGFGLGLGLGYGLGYGYGYGYPGYYGGYGYGYGAPVYVYPAPYSANAPCPTNGPAVPNAPPSPSQAPGQRTPEIAPPPLKLTDADVLLNVRVPPNATVWINGSPTSQTGPRREFISSGLTPGQTYNYDVRARWTTPDGTVVDLKKRVPAQGGERRSVDFAATPAGEPSAPQHAESYASPQPVGSLPPLMTAESGQGAEGQQEIARQLNSLGDSSEGVRLVAVTQLGHLKAQQAVDQLAAVLAGDKSPKVREAAARALGLLRDPKALPALQQAVQVDADHEVRRTAQFSIEVIQSQ